LEVPGIGPWTADYVIMRAVGWPDSFLEGDLAVRKALGGITAAEAKTTAAKWSPWRSYAVFHLWRSLEK
jgi:AraC family transcriptional regulator of adaptative response / DNA-3-methyladenine glycosylase II